MGRSTTPTYFARYRDQAGWHDISWNGRATDERAEDMRRALNASFQPGAHNFHVSEAAGYVIHVSRLYVIRNDRSERVVARAVAPMFEVV